MKASRHHINYWGLTIIHHASHCGLVKLAEDCFRYKFPAILAMAKNQTQLSIIKVMVK